MRYPSKPQVVQGTNHSFDANVYTRLGVKPFINANLPFTFLSATVVWPEVRRAIDEAAHYMVDVVFTCPQFFVGVYCDWFCER